MLHMQSWDEWGYLWCGVLTVAPLLVIPLLAPGEADRGKPLLGRFWVKANVWIAIFGFIGNYFWTHYFFQLLGAAYTMPSHRLNNVCLYCLQWCFIWCDRGLQVAPTWLGPST
jgi:cycloeucalenol cycloisomerase